MKKLLYPIFGLILAGTFTAFGCKKSAPSSTSSTSDYMTTPGNSFPNRVMARNEWINNHLSDLARKYQTVNGNPSWKPLDSSYSGDKYTIETEPNLSRPDGTKLRLGFVFNNSNEGTLVQVDKWDIKASTWTSLPLKK